MLPIMDFYTDKERRDILSILLNHLQESTKRSIYGDIALSQRCWNAIYRGDYIMEYTKGVMLFTLPEVQGRIPIKVKLSDVVTWIIGEQSGHRVKLPITVYKTIYDIPHRLTSGTRLVLPETSGDALINTLTTIIK